MKILIVEDEHLVAQFVERALTEQAYTVRRVDSCATARDALAKSPYDAIVLDFGLPDGDGLELLREWRAAGVHEPVLILSARDAAEDRIRGLNLGADDFLSKPFGVGEVVARIQSLLRRQTTGNKVTVLHHRGIRVDLLGRTVTLDDIAVELTTREFALLELFLRQQGHVLTRTLIAEKVWDAPDDLSTNLVDVYVGRLRTKLERPGRPQLIKTVRGMGYQLE